MSTATEQGERGSAVARFFGALQERWWLILCTVIIAGGIAFGVSLLLESKYATAADIIYSAGDAEEVSKALTDAGRAGLVHNISTDAVEIKTSEFAARAIRALGDSVTVRQLLAAIDASADPEADVIRIQAVSSDPALAADMANACADGFILQRKTSIQNKLQDALDFVQGRIDSLTTAEKDSTRGEQLEGQLYALERLMADDIADYRVLEKAAVPTTPYYPKPFINLLYGVIAGLVFGLFLALILGSLDRRIKDAAALERIMDLPVLGAMPMASRKQSGRPSGKNSAVGFRKGNEAILESMRMLRSNLKVLGFGDTKRSVLITSTAPAEGKSTLAVNLALSMALAGDRVILVDADLRNPAIHKYLNVPNENGLGDALTDNSVSWSERIQAVELAPFVDERLISSRPAGEVEPPVSKFLCLTSGTLPANPTEMLESSVSANLLADLQGISDYVIVDGPPMLMASDSMILAQSVDAVILASTLGKETAAEAKQVRQLLSRAEIQALGLVVCGSRPQIRDNYYYRSQGERSNGTRRG